MAHSNHTYPAHIPATDRRSNVVAWVLFGIAALLLAVAVIVPPQPQATIDAVGQSGPPMIEDWSGNGASMRPAE